MIRFAVGLMLVVLPVALVHSNAQVSADAGACKAAGVEHDRLSPRHVRRDDAGWLDHSGGVRGRCTTPRRTVSRSRPASTYKGDQIVVSDNSDACGMSGEGTYTWALDGKALTSRGPKTRATRLQIMTGYSFVKKSS